MRRLAAKVGITKRVHPHGLRHTFAVELEAAGTHITVISALLGHSSVAVTARYLNHLTHHQAVTALTTAELPPMTRLRCRAGYRRMASQASTAASPDLRLPGPMPQLARGGAAQLRATPMRPPRDQDETPRDATRLLNPQLAPGLSSPA